MNFSKGLFILFAFFTSFLSQAQLRQEDIKVNSQDMRLQVNRYEYSSKSNHQKQILLVHGLTYSSHEFHIDYGDYSLVRYLTDHGYIVWSVDIAGYGLSTIPKDGFEVNTAYAARDILSVANYIIRSEPVDKIDVLGWSWGTMTTSLFSKDHHQLIRKLVLYAPLCHGYGGQVIDNAWHENTWTHAASDFQVRNGMIDNEIVDEVIVAYFTANCWKFDGDQSPNGGRRELLSSPDSVFIKPTYIPVATLFIWGGNDLLVDANKVLKIYETHPLKEKCQLTIIPGGGHAIMMEKPYYQQFRYELLGFLEKK